MATNAVHADLIDLRERLIYLADQTDERVVFVLGSGLSSGAVPDVASMTTRFLSSLAPNSQANLREQWNRESANMAARYQSAAATVAKQRSERLVTRIIRQAVFEAYRGPSVDIDKLSGAQARELLKAEYWHLPESHRGFARYYASLPDDRRTPIITTNFDPLIEVALAEHGILSHPIPVSYDDPPTIDVLNHEPAVPILHIHGYFADQWSLNSLRHIRGVRSNLESLLDTLIAGSTVVVLAYGAWEDSFMRVLEKHASQRTILNAEIAWCAYTPHAEVELAHPVLNKLLRGPGFSLYRGIDAAAVFDVPRQIPDARFQAAAPSGWTNLPVGGSQPPSSTARRRFAEGASPSWADSFPDAWPQLATATEALKAVAAGIENRGSRLVALIGPVGEGKSTALRQIATRIALENQDVGVFWREQGAPPLSNWLQSDERKALTRVLLCVDEADLAASDVEAIAAAAESDAEVTLVIACQDRLWWKQRVARREDFETIVFAGIASGDAQALAKSWVSNEVVVNTPIAGESVRQIAESLNAASVIRGDKRSSTLFGAILQVREGDGLKARVVDLMAKLFAIDVGVDANAKVTLGQIFASIAILEVYSPRAPSFEGGASRAFISEAAGASSPLASGAVLRALGREASITLAGDFVYTRHPKIAALVVDWLKNSRKFNSAVKFTSKVGGCMKQEAYTFNRSQYRDAYFLASNLEAGAAAQAAAAGAIEGASRFMEPRISYLSIVRRFDLAAAERYAQGVVGAADQALDRRSSMRVLLNELAIIAYMGVANEDALGLAALILHNGTGTAATREQISYGLGTMAVSLGRLTAQVDSRDRFVVAAVLTRAIARKLLPEENFNQFIGPHLNHLNHLSDIEQKPLGWVLDRLSVELSPIAQRVISTRRLPFKGKPGPGADFIFAKRLEFTDLIVLE